jgi:hypothetical protein
MSNGILTGNAIGISVLKVSITPSAVSTIEAPAETFTVTGVEVGDAVIVNPPSQTADIAIANAYVSAADTVSIQFVNPTVGSLTPAAGEHIFTVIRPEQATQTSYIK